MATDRDLKILSIGSGVIALGLAAWHRGLRTLLPEEIWFLINWLDSLGVIGGSQSSDSIIRNAGVFGIDAKFALFMIGYVSVCFACFAIFFAFRADQQRSPTLYPAIASVLGALSLSLFNVYFGFLGFVVVAALIARSRRDP
jgi:hypothetical protein